MIYRAKVWKSGRLTELEVEAPNASSAVAMFESHGRVVGPVKLAQSSFKRTSAGASYFQLAEDLLVLLKAGLSLVESLELLQKKAGEKGALLTTLRSRIGEGMSFSRALDGNDAPSLLVALVQSSEQTGALTFALERFVEHERRAVELRRKISAALTYPALLAVTGIIVVTFLMFYVVPRFALIFEDLRGSSSTTAELMVWWSGLIVERGQSMLIAFIVATLFFIAMLSKRSTRYRIMQQILRYGRLTSIVSKYQLANVSRTLSMLCEGGIPLLRSLHIAAGAANDLVLKRKLTLVIDSVANGSTVSSSFEKASLGDDVAVRLLAVGERAGDLANALGQVAQICDGEVRSWLEHFTRLFEPALMLAIGLVVGLIVVLMYMPIFELAGSLQ